MLPKKYEPDAFVFQSLLDFTCSLVLLLSTTTITDFNKAHNPGFLGWIECYLWNSEFLSFGLFLSSTWNIVVLTVERFVIQRMFKVAEQTCPNEINCSTNC